MTNPRRQKKGMTEQRRQRAAKALQYRKDGRSYEWIAKELGVSATCAHEDVAKALEEITRDAAEEVRNLELERLDTMFIRLNAEMARLQKAAKEGEVAADKVAGSIARIVESQLRIQDRRARYLGLDTQTPKTTTDVADAIRAALQVIDPQ